MFCFLFYRIALEVNIMKGITREEQVHKRINDLLDEIGDVLVE